LVWDAAEVAEIQEEVTRVWAAAIMVGAQAPQAERVAQEIAILLVCAHVEADEVVQRVSLLKGKLVDVCRARDAAQVKLSCLVEKAVAADR
jgi:hypothetical protein